MGIGDWIKDKVTPQFVKDVNTALTPKKPAKAAPAATSPTAPTPAPVEAKTPQQAAYEAKIDAMNKNNPYYKAGDAVPRCKGGSVMAGGHRAKGEPVKKGEALWNGQPVKKV